MDRQRLLNSCIGEYRLTDMLGAGGMGEVYRGVHAKIGRVVAVKVLNQTTASPQFLDRFLNEARIQASLQHPNIVTLYDFLEYNGQPCIIMEYIEGETLTDRIRLYGALPVEQAIAVMKALVDALHYVHGRNIVHRDIKSNNIKITSEGLVKLLDFGIAKSDQSPTLTATGGFVGTLQYLSPEQLKGGYADVRSDVWALGVLLYEMVTGRLPFEATTIGDLYERISKVTYTPAPVLNPAVPRELQNIIARCLKKNPADRYQSVVDLGRALEMCESRLRLPTIPIGRSVNTAPVPPVLQPQEQLYSPPAALPSTGRKVWAAVAVAAVLLVLVLAGGVYLTMDPEPNTPMLPVTNQPTRSPGPRDSTPDLKTYTLDVYGGRAEVYRAGQMVGITPYEFEARHGERLSFILRGAGFDDKEVDLSVTEGKRVYTFSMEQRE